MRLTLRFLSIAFIFSSCATIVGGSKYTANVTVKNNSGAGIYYNGAKIGLGSASIKIPRKDADKVLFVLKNEGCESQQTPFFSRSLRGWAFGGSLVFFTSLLPFPIPFGLAIDLATGALYKPDVNHMAIQRFSMNSYLYSLEYAGCDANRNRQPPPANLIESENEAPLIVTPRVKTKEQKLIELKELFDGGMITEQEYQESRRAVLAQ
jgi:hypothetical protein